MKTDEVIDAYINTSSALDIILAFDAQNVSNEQGPWIRHSCLIDRVDQHHSHGDQSPSAAIDVASKRYSCFSYGVVSCKHFLSIMFKDDKNKIIQFLKDIPRVSDSSFDDKLKAAFTKEAVRRNHPMSMSILETFSDDHSYMIEKRGVSDDVCKLFDVKYDVTTRMVVFPLFERSSTSEGKRLVGFQRRSTEGNGPKYDNDSGLVKDKLLYYGSEAYDSKEVIVVESIVSVLKLETYGIRNSIATLGSKILPEQADLLLRHRSIKLWYDDDLSGVSGAIWLANRLKSGAIVSIVVSDMRHYDPADMTKEQVERNLDNAMPLFDGLPFLYKCKALLRGTK